MTSSENYEPALPPLSRRDRWMLLLMLAALSLGLVGVDDDEESDP